MAARSGMNQFVGSGCRDCVAKQAKLNDISSQLDTATKRLLSATAFWSVLNVGASERREAGDVSFRLTVRDEQNAPKALTASEVGKIEAVALPCDQTVTLTKPAPQELSLTISRDEVKKSYGITFVPATPRPGADDALLVKKAPDGCPLVVGDIVTHVDGGPNNMLDRLKKLNSASVKVQRDLHAQYGLTVARLNKHNSNAGPEAQRVAMLVTEVSPGSPAETDGGIEVGDLITAINGQSVEAMGKVDDLSETLLQSASIGLSIVKATSSYAWRCMRGDDVSWTKTVTHVGDDQYDITMTNIPAAMYRVKLSLAGFAFNDVFDVLVTPGLAAPQCCVIADGNYTSVTAGSELSFVVAVCDAYGNRRSVGGDAVGIKPVEGAATQVVAAAVVSDCNNGSYNVTWRLIEASRAFPFHVLVNGDLSGERPFHVDVKPSEISVADCSVEVHGGEWAVDAGESLGMTITVRDEFGNKCDRGGDKIVVATTPAEGHTQPTATSTGLEKGLRIRDDRDGSYFASWTLTKATLAHPFTIEANGITLFSHTVNVIPSTVALGKCVIEIDGGVWAVTAGDAAVMTLAVCDAYGNKRDRFDDEVAVIPLVASTGSGSGRGDESEKREQNVISVVSNNDGTYALTWVATKATSTQAFNIEINGDRLSTKPLRMDVQPAAVCLDKCEVTVDGGGDWRVTASQTLSFTVRVRDRFGNHRNRGRELGHDRVEVQSLVTSKNPILPGSVTKGKGANKVGGAVTWAPAVVDNEDGSWSVSWVLTAATRVHPFRVLINGEVKSSHDVDVVPAAVSLSSCVVTVDSNEGQWWVTAGDSLQLTVTVCDSFGNKRNRGGDVVQVVELGDAPVAATGANGRRGTLKQTPQQQQQQQQQQKAVVSTDSTPEVEDNEDGTYSIFWPLTTATRVKSFHITVNGDRLQSRPFEVDVRPAEVALSACRVVIDDEPVVVAGKVLAFSVEVCDRFGNRRNRAVDDIEIQYLDDDGQVIEHQQQLQGASGGPVDSIPAINSSNAGNYPVTWNLRVARPRCGFRITVNTEVLSTHNVDVRPDQASLPHCTVDVGGNGEWRVVAGQTLDVTVTVRDALGNVRDRGVDDVRLLEVPGRVGVKGGASATSVDETSSTVGVIANNDGTYTISRLITVANRALPLMITVNGATLSTHEVHVVADDVSLTHCYVNVVGGDWTTIAGQMFVMQVNLCDKFGNRRVACNDVVDIVDNGDTPATAAPTTADNGDGTVTVSWCLTKATLAHNIVVQVNGLDLSSHGIDVKPAGVSLAKCRVESTTGSWVVTAGQVLEFTVEVCDEFGNLRDRSVDDVVIADQGDPKAERLPTIVANGDGSFAVSWMLQRAAWAHAFAVLVNGEAAQTRVFEIGVLPGATCAAQCQFFGDGLVAAVSHIPARFMVCTKDEFGNDIGTGGDLVEITFVGCSMREDSVAVTDNLNGTYTVIYRVPSGGTLQLFSSVNKSSCQNAISIPVRGVAEWTPEDSADWTKLVLGLEDLSTEFSSQNVDGQALLSLTPQQLLNEFGLRDFGTRRRVAMEIAALDPTRETNDVSVEQTPPPVSP